MTKAKKLNIVILIKDLPSGGAEKQALILTKVLSEHHNVKMVLLRDEINEKHQSFIDSNNIPIDKVLGSSLKRIFAFRKYLKSNKVDVVFSYLLTGNFFGGVVGKMAGVKQKVGGIRCALLAPNKTKIERILHNYFNDYTIFNNYCGAEYYSNNSFKSSKIKVIHNCIEFNHGLPSKNGVEKVEIISVGRFVEQKDYYSALLTIKQLVNQKQTKIRYTIIGWGSLEQQVRDWIKELELHDYVRIVINPKNIFDYYKSSDIYFCSSSFEGLSNSIMEAMSYALPCVATKAGDNDKLVKHEYNGFLVKTKDVEAMVESLNELIKNRVKRLDMGKNSYQKIINEFSVQAFTNNYLEFINSVTKVD